MAENLEGLRPETIAVRAGRPAAAPDVPMNAPLVMASTFHAGGSTAYAREGHPTWAAFEEALGALEGGVAVAFSTGMGAVAAVLDDLPRGARVVLPSVSYADLRTMLGERAGDRLVSVQVDVTDTPATLAACDGAAMLWLESPTNPMIGIADLAALSEGGRAAGATVVVDNTFATPVLQRPLDLGADVVVHSATKFIGGHSDLMLGAAVTRDEDRAARLRQTRRLQGAAPGTLETWLGLRGLRTLPLRIERGQATATELARRLSENPAVTAVHYPGLPEDPGHEVARGQMAGFGAMVAFEVEGGAGQAEAACERVRVITHATSLGGVETLMERRARWPGDAHVPPALIRMSVGCEHVEDLWADLEQALAGSATSR